MTDEEKIEEIRKRKMEELQNKTQKEQQESQRQREAEVKKKSILRQYLTDGARRRLNTVKMTKPQFAQAAEKQIIALAQSGRLTQQIDEDQMKEILQEMKPDDNGFDISRR